MFCEPHRKALREAVLAGGRLPGRTEAHLDRCAGCREALAEEQALLRRIDAGVGSLVVREMPASLIPGVRARITGAAESRSGWRLVVACAAAALAVGTVAVSVGMRGKAPRVQLETPGASTLPALKSPTATPPVADAYRKALPAERLVMAKPPVAAGRRARRNRQSDVLITGDEQRGLAQYIAAFREQASGNKATLKEEAGAEIKPLEIAELDVKRLAIEPLEGSNFN